MTDPAWRIDNWTFDGHELRITAVQTTAYSGISASGISAEVAVTIDQLRELLNAVGPVVTVDEATIPKTVKIEPLKLRVVVEPSDRCHALRSEFIEAAEFYTAQGRKFGAVKAMNIAQRAVSEGCWR